ncbi:hypothetical protein [Paraburkholderia elongata]|uniref:Uncharacterized protein n=1 Tax=Paraburkholderia elongata TaxID=2675747 RepID=A0A972NNU5_9BURK|nr:hypothetical protein [Paraburkholderia elongata]NPT56326.1 hypothetical protein [Paraburkholderia elongata]NPT56344.1 hypothetical protein [Paraburkholderia elongata]NPT56357.1 hypothetical protein [Paraburkholderia elongata]
MTKNPLPSRRSPMLNIAGRTLTAVAAFAASCLLAYGQPPVVTNTSTYGDAAEASGTIVDNCKSGFFDIHVYANAGVTHGGGATTQLAAYSFVEVAGYDTCTQTTFGNSYSGPVQFSADDSKGVQVPKTVTASGQLPSDDGTDTVTFNMALNGVGVAYQDKRDDHEIFSFGNSVLKIDDKADMNATLGTGAVTISSQSVGNLSVSNFVVYLYNYKTHVLTVTR